MSAPGQILNIPQMVVEIHQQVGVLLERTKTIDAVKEDVTELKTKMHEIVGNGKPGKLAEYDRQIREHTGLIQQISNRLNAQQWFQKGSWKTAALIGTCLISFLDLVARLWPILRH